MAFRHIPLAEVNPSLQKEESKIHGEHHLEKTLRIIPKNACWAKNVKHQPGSRDEA